MNTVIAVWVFVTFARESRIAVSELFGFATSEETFDSLWLEYFEGNKDNENAVTIARHKIE